MRNNARGRQRLHPATKTFLALRICGESRVGGTRAVSIVLVALVLLFSFAVAGCAARNADPSVRQGANAPEQIARDAFYAAKGFVEQAQDNHEAECVALQDTPLGSITDERARKAKKICIAINQAADAQNLLGHAINQYCGGPGYLEGGDCNPQVDVEARLRAAIVDLNQYIANLKGLLRK